ncbi:MAG TPA: regulatory protein RecX [Myxococcota bacterium]|nr:regulatory protein RecX [Myxococcota bacterium]HRY91873.1 regulatory protein RecX [Myxococcota bacterium]HSA24581.1 regulatory protein RecX [Myxococcota bacterium]
MPGRGSRPPADAHEAALRLLDVRERSRRELAGRLREKGFEPAQIEPELERLAEVGLLDDRRFACLRARALVRRGQGPRRIEADLRARGVSREDIAAALEQALEGERPAERMRALVVKRFGEGCLGAEADPKLRARAQRYLLQKGFAPDEVLPLFER